MAIISSPAAKQAKRFARTPVETWPGYDDERRQELAQERWADELTDAELKETETDD